MNIKDYLHLYIGCKALLMDYDSVTGAPKEFNLTVYNLNSYRDWISEIKPILRPLSDMNDSEREESKDYIPLQKQSYNLHYFEDTRQAAKYFQWLLSKHFDLFGLIEAGLAIDKTTINKVK